jgi:hypothetical protein
VHVLAEAQEKLAEVTEYPVAPFISMIGCITVLALSQVVEGVVTSRRIARRQAALTAAKEAKEAKNAAAADTAASSAASTAAGGNAVALGVGAARRGGEEKLVSIELPMIGNGGGEQQPQRQHAGADSMKEHQRQLMEKLSLAKLAVHAEEGGEEDASHCSGGKDCGHQMDEVALAVLEAGRLPLSEASSLNTPRNKSRSNSLTIFDSPKAAGGPGLSGSGRKYHRSAAARRMDLMERRSSSFQLSHQHGGHHDAEHIVYSFKTEGLVVAYLMEIGACSAFRGCLCVCVYLHIPYVPVCGPRPGLSPDRLEHAS